MNRTLAVLSALSILLVTGAANAQKISRDGRSVSPFRGMRVAGDGLEVQVADDTWFALESIAGIETADLLRRTQEVERNWWKRLTEDLPAVFDALGQPVGESVDLVVRDLATGERRELPGVKMTAANRQLLWKANQGAVAPKLAPAEALPATLSAADVQADLAQLRTLLDGQFAYRDLRGVDLAALLRQAEGALGREAVPTEALARAVDRILRAFGDGHSRIDGLKPAGDTFLPFLVQHTAGGHAAFLPSRTELVDPRRPFVEAIDGVPLERWIDAARKRGTQGSVTMQRREAERGLRDLGELRAALELPAVKHVMVTLRGEKDTREVQLAVATGRPTYGAWPLTKTRRLDDDVGYLRLPTMSGDAEFLDGIDAAMTTFQNTKGLIVDVRGNGGGTRDALRRLAPYLLPANGTPVVGNVAAILRVPGEPVTTTALADRGLYPADWEGWTDAQRTAITQFARTFQPSWKLPAGKFSPWHFLVLDRSDNAKAFAYGKRVVVLIDRGCFSATDVFAAALGALPNVTLLGESTSGGSGRARGFRLGKSGIRLQLSSMASFRPDGVLFEGNGVVPDVVCETVPEDLIGVTDLALQRARELLR